MTKKFLLKFICVVLCMCLGTCMFTGCEDEDDVDFEDAELSEHAFNDDKHPVVKIVVKEYGTIFVELYPEVAPNTVNNFISLVEDGFYDGLTFHRVIEKFMIQGGCPKGDGTGDPGYKIKGEFTANGFENNLKHERGVISMARGGYSNDSAGCQFFIMHVDYPSLDEQYASFGRVVAGMDVVDAIATCKKDALDYSVPKDTVVIKSITVDTKGVDYPAPEKV